MFEGEVRSTALFPARELTDIRTDPYQDLELGLEFLDSSLYLIQYSIIKVLDQQAEMN